MDYTLRVSYFAERVFLPIWIPAFFGCTTPRSVLAVGWQAMFTDESVTARGEKRSFFRIGRFSLGAVIVTDL